MPFQPFAPFRLLARILRLNDDVRVSGDNPLVHFERCGLREVADDVFFLLTTIP